MTSRINVFRSFMLVLGLTIIAAFAVQSSALAQTPCACADVYLKVDPNIACKVNICVKDLSGLNCLSIPPGGGLFPVPCNTVYAFYLLDCNGNYVFVDANNPVNCVCMAPGCCVNAFVVKDINGCWVIKVEPAPATCVC